MPADDSFLTSVTARWHDKLIEILQAYPRGKLLDIPCETGNLTRKLQILGFQVTGSDINSANLKQTNIPFTRADLNQTLPFEDAVYDYIVCAEGIEHVENQYQMIREFARILKPSGTLFITTPNILALKARLKFLTRGALAGFRAYSDNPEANYLSTPGGHINPIAFPELKYMLQRYGFNIGKICTDRYLGEKNIFYWLLSWMIRARTLKKTPDARFLLKKDFLYGEHLIITAPRRSE